jgi:hypothetical protein
MDAKSEYQGALANSKSGLRELLKACQMPKSVNKYWGKSTQPTKSVTKTLKACANVVRKYANYKKCAKHPKNMDI